VGVWVCGCVYKIENFRSEAISSSAAFELKLKNDVNSFKNTFYQNIQATISINNFF
jgi:hypothetical protein